MTNEGVQADLSAAFQFLEQQTAVREDHIAAVGFCLAGRTAITANTILALYAAVSFYGGLSSMLPDHADVLHGRMLFFLGLLDKHYDCAVRASVTDPILQARKILTNVDVSGADHGFFCDARSLHNADAARQAWALTLEFLRET